MKKSGWMTLGCSLERSQISWFCLWWYQQVKTRQNELMTRCTPVGSVLSVAFHLVGSWIQLRVESWWAKPCSGQDQSELHQPPQSFQSISTISGYMGKKKAEKSQISWCCTIPELWHLPDISWIYLFILALILFFETVGSNKVMMGGKTGRQQLAICLEGM